MKKSKQYVLKIVGCMMLVMVCALIVFSYQDFPARLMAAILGVVITATITVVLLDGQSKKEQTAKRNSKVFEEKLKIYKNFLDTLYGAVKDEELTDKEKIELQYQTSLVAMHCEPENILKLSEAVKKVITMMCKPDRQRSSNNNVLLETLFDVVEALRKDLYAKDDIKTFSDDVRQRTIDNFNVAYSNAKEGNTDVNDNKQHLSVDLNVLSDISCIFKSGKIGSMEEVKPIESGLSSEKQKAYNTSEWNLAVKDWQSQGWEVKALESEDCPLEITRNDGNPGKIDMGFYNGHYYLQAGYEGDSNFS